KSAQEVMDECVNSGRYSNRKALMQHREAVTKAANVEPPPEPEPEPPVPFTMKTVWWYFGAVGAVALFALVRALLRWSKGGGLGSDEHPRGSEDRLAPLLLWVRWRCRCAAARAG